MQTGAQSVSITKLDYIPLILCNDPNTMAYVDVIKQSTGSISQPSNLPLSSSATLLHPTLQALISCFVRSLHFTAGFTGFFPSVAVITPNRIHFV